MLTARNWSPFPGKEVRISDTERFVICHNPGASERDKHMRDQLTAELAELIDGSGQLSDFKRGELRGKIASKPGLNRYLRTTPAGKLRTDTAKIKTEENLDGKYLLCCSGPHLSAEDIALGYKQLLEVEMSKPQCCHICGLPALSSAPAFSCCPMVMLAAWFLSHHRRLCWPRGTWCRARSRSTSAGSARITRSRAWGWR